MRLSSNSTKAYRISGIAIWQLGVENINYSTSAKTNKK